MGTDMWTVSNSYTLIERKNKSHLRLYQWRSRLDKALTVARWSSGPLVVCVVVWVAVSVTSSCFWFSGANRRIAGRNRSGLQELRCWRTANVTARDAKNCCGHAFSGADGGDMCSAGSAGWRSGTAASVDS